MYRCSIYGTDKINQYEELIKVFLQPGEYEISGVAEVPDDLPAKVSAEAPAKDPAPVLFLPFQFSTFDSFLPLYNIEKFCLYFPNLVDICSVLWYPIFYKIHKVV